MYSRLVGGSFFMPFQKGDKTYLLSLPFLVRCEKCKIFKGKKIHICRTKQWIKKNCQYCNKEILTIAAEIKRGHGKYCSRRCKELFYTGKSIFINDKAEKSSMWKGNNVSYKGLHKWIGENLGKPTTCEDCGKTGLTGRWIHWANISGLYLRKPTDWKRLCAKCHKKYDRKEVKDKRKAIYLEEDSSQEIAVPKTSPTRE